MKRAWEFLITNVDYNNCFMLVREFNKICMENFRQDAGEIRKGIVGIGGTNWTTEIPIDREVFDNILKIDKIESPIDKALKYFCYLSRTQIFNGGNKRVAQLMANKVLIENGIGVFQTPVEVLEPFKSLLISYYESGNDSDIIGFMKNYCIRYLDKGFVKEYENTKKVSIDKFEDAGELPKFVLSSNQIKIFNSILRNLRSLLYAYGIEGSVLLKEVDGNIILESSQSQDGTIYTRYCSGGYECSYNVNIINEFILETVKSLVCNIPFPIKKLWFDVNGNDLYFGDFVNSHDGKGSINIRLL